MDGRGGPGIECVLTQVVEHALHVLALGRPQEVLHPARQERRWIRLHHGANAVVCRALWSCETIRAVRGSSSNLGRSCPNPPRRVVLVAPDLPVGVVRTRQRVKARAGCCAGRNVWVLRRVWCDAGVAAGCVHVMPSSVLAARDWALGQHTG